MEMNKGMTGYSCYYCIHAISLKNYWPNSKHPRPLSGINSVEEDGNRNENESTCSGTGSKGGQDEMHHNTTSSWGLMEDNGGGKSLHIGLQSKHEIRDEGDEGSRVSDHGCRQFDDIL